MGKLYLILFFIALSFSGFTQTKYEKEIRLKNKEAPPIAQSFIDSFYFSKKVKWYKEFGINKTSIEAKTKHQGKRYSIEFSPDGTLEDVEIELKMEEIPFDVQTAITAHLQSRYKKYNISKAQIQYVGKQSSILSHLKNRNFIEEIQTNYELIINTKENRTYKKYEFLFSEDGKFLQQAEIVLKNTDNIEY